MTPSTPAAPSSTPQRDSFGLGLLLRALGLVLLRGAAGVGRWFGTFWFPICLISLIAALCGGVVSAAGFYGDKVAVFGPLMIGCFGFAAVPGSVLIARGVASMLGALVRAVKREAAALRGRQ